MGIVRGVVRGLSQDSVKGGPGARLAKRVLRASQGVGALRGWSTLGGKRLWSQEAQGSFSSSASGPSSPPCGYAKKMPQFWGAGVGRGETSYVRITTSAAVSSKSEKAFFKQTLIIGAKRVSNK